LNSKSRRKRLAPLIKLNVRSNMDSAINKLESGDNDEHAGRDVDIESSLETGAVGNQNLDTEEFLDSRCGVDLSSTSQEEYHDVHSEPTIDSLTAVEVLIEKACETVVSNEETSDNIDCVVGQMSRDNQSDVVNELVSLQEVVENDTSGLLLSRHRFEVTEDITHGKIFYSAPSAEICMLRGTASSNIVLKETAMQFPMEKFIYDQRSVLNKSWEEGRLKNEFNELDIASSKLVSTSTVIGIENGDSKINLKEMENKSSFVRRELDVSILFHDGVSNTLKVDKHAANLPDTLPQIETSTKLTDYPKESSSLKIANRKIQLLEAEISELKLQLERAMQSAVENTNSAVNIDVSIRWFLFENSMH